MNIKNLQDIHCKIVVSLFKVSTSTRGEVILVELRKILTKAQMLVQEESGFLLARTMRLLSCRAYPSSS
jgi:hypothetical protein